MALETRGQQMFIGRKQKLQIAMILNFKLLQLTYLKQTYVSFIAEQKNSRRINKN